jgi:hypothetical protein
MMDYLVIASECLDELQQQVQFRQRDGWKCQGGVAVVNAEVFDPQALNRCWQLFFYQAMVIDDETMYMMKQCI